MFLEVLLIRIQHAIEPWQELLSAVICVKDDRNTVGWGNGTDIVSGCDSSSD